MFRPTYQEVQGGFPSGSLVDPLTGGIAPTGVLADPTVACYLSAVPGVGGVTMRSNKVITLVPSGVVGFGVAAGLSLDDREAYFAALSGYVQCGTALDVLPFVGCLDGAFNASPGAVNAVRVLGLLPGPRHANSPGSQGSFCGAVRPTLSFASLGASPTLLVFGCLFANGGTTSPTTRSFMVTADVTRFNAPDIGIDRVLVG